MSDPTAPEKSPHADWHRETFTKRAEATIVWPAYSTPHGGNFPEVTRQVTLNSARAVIVQRVLNGLTPAEWQAAATAFDASPEGVALETKDAPTRREHLELWLARTLFEGGVKDDAGNDLLVPASELALQKVLDHHAHPTKVAAHRAALMKSLAPPVTVSHVDVAPPAGS